MKKLVNLFLVTLVITLSIYSCQNDEINFNDTSQKLNHENVHDFIKKHLEINNKILTILDEEKNINKEILFKSVNKNITNENEFKIILEKSGIINFNELSDLILIQVQNSEKFQLNNAAFFKLNESEKNELLYKSIDEALNNTLIGLNAKTQNSNSVYSSCESQLDTDKSRCERDLNLHGTFAIISCFSGPWTCALASTLVLIEHTNCVDDANEDYQNCTNS